MAISGKTLQTVRHSLILILLVVCTRLWVIDDPFILDDFTLLIKLQDQDHPAFHKILELYSFARPGETSSWHAWWSDPGLRLSYFRPLAGFLLWLDFELWGRNPLPYHVTSLLLYLGCVLAMYRFAALLYKSQIGLCAAAVFAVSPVHFTNIEWVANRVDIVSGFWQILGYSIYVNRRAEANRQWRTAILVTGCYVLGLLGKENALMFPLSLLLLHAILNYEPAADRPGSARIYRQLLWKTQMLLVSISAIWGGLFIARGHGVNSGYSLVSLASFWDFLHQMVKALLLYLYSLVGHIELQETMKFDMVDEYLHVTILLLCLGAICIMLVNRILGRRGLYLMILTCIPLLAAAPFRLSDRLCFLSVVWVALLVGGVLKKLFESSLPMVMKATGTAIVLGWMVLAAADEAIDRTARREEWCSQQDDFIAQTRAFLGKAPQATTLFYLNLPTPLFAVSLADNISWNFPNRKLRCYPLTVFFDPPLILLKDQHTFRLRSSINYPFFSSLTEKIFLVSDTPDPERVYTTLDFRARVGRINEDGVSEVEYVFTEPVTHPTYVFVSWGTSGKAAATQLSFAQAFR